MTCRPTRVRMVLLALALLACALAGCGGAGQRRATVEARPPDPLSVAPAASRPALTRLRQSAGSGAALSTDRHGTARVLAGGRPLTGPSRGPAATVVRRWARDHASALGLARADVRGARAIVRRGAGGVRTVRLDVLRHGVPVIDAGVRALVDRRGRLRAISGGRRGATVDTTPAFDGEDARRRATGTAAPEVVERTSTLIRFADSSSARLVIEGDRLLWRVLHRDAGGTFVDHVLDARDGRTVRTSSLERSAQEALAFGLDPERSTQEAVELTAWMTSGAAQTLRDGKIVSAWVDENDDGVVQPGEDVEAVAGDWLDARQQVGKAPHCSPAICSWDTAVDGSWRTNRRQGAVQTFVNANRMIDWLDERLAFGGLRATGDTVRTRAMAGAAAKNDLPDAKHLNNAKMATLPEGDGFFLDAYLTREPDPGSGKLRHAYSGDDLSMLAHELGHAFVGRAVTTADGVRATSWAMSVALDEAVADVLAGDFLDAKPHQLDGADDGDFALLRHSAVHGRLQPLDCPVQTTACRRPDGAPGGLRYADYGTLHGSGVREPHADGLILAQALWDLRRALSAAHGPGEGQRRFREDLAAALTLLPSQPTFLDLRNALIGAADARDLTDSTHVWTVFAERGMGWSATADDADVPKVTAADDLPDALAPGSVMAGTVTDEATGAPIEKATLSLAGHDTCTACAPNLSTRSTAAGLFALPAPAGDYQLKVRRPGYAPRRLAVTPGRVQTVPVRLRRNFADVFTGATLLSGSQPVAGCGQSKLFDSDSRTSWWVSSGDAVASVELPEAISLAAVAVDPSAGCLTDDATSRPKAVEIDVILADGTLVPNVMSKRIARSDDGTFTMLRPAAPIDDVKEIVVTADARAGARGVSMSEVMVFAARPGPPTARLTSPLQHVRAGQAMTLSASGSAPAGAPLRSYAWDLDGNGSFEVTEDDPEVEARFDEPGVHVVALRVTDAAGASDDTRTRVEVETEGVLTLFGTDGHAGAWAERIDEQARIAGGAFDGAAPWQERTWATYAGTDGHLDPLVAPWPGRPFVDVTDLGPVGRAIGDDAGRSFADHRPLQWDGGAPQLLPLLAGARRQRNFAINASSTRVGVWTTADDRTRPQVTSADGVPRDLQDAAAVPPDERRDGVALDVNDRGVVLGCWDGTRLCSVPWLHELGDVGPRSFRAVPGGLQPVALTDDGRIYGNRTLGDRSEAMTVAADGTVQPLAAPPGAEQTRVLGAAEQGWAVGTARGADGDQAVLWRDRPAYLRDLVDVPAGWRLVYAIDVNDHGEVVGWARNDDSGQVRPFLARLGACRVCLDDVELLERDLDGDQGWEPIGADGTVDGNRVKVTATLRNDDDVPRTVHLDGLRVEHDAAQIDPQGAADEVTIAPGQERPVELVWDTDGAAWDGGRAAVDERLRLQPVVGEAVFDQLDVVVKIRPRPVVLVHGLYADASDFDHYQDLLADVHPDWEAFAVGDGRVPGLEMYTGTKWNPFEKIGSIDEHADVLARYVAGVRERTNAERVDIVGHSRGGIVGRAYVAGPMPETVGGLPVVKNLVTLGSPHRGSGCADAFPEWRATWELTTGAMALFNEVVRARKGVHFSAAVGESWPITCTSPAPGDGVVETTSATWEIVDHEVIEADHAQLREAPEIFRSFVKRRLDGTGPFEGVEGAGAGAAANRAVPEPEPEVDADPAGPVLTTLGTRRLSLAGGAPQSAAYEIPASTRRLATEVLAGPGTHAALVAPDGTVEDEGTVDAELLLALSAKDPAAGRWEVRLTGPPRHATEAAITARLDGDPVDVAVRARRLPGGRGWVGGRVTVDGAAPGALTAAAATVPSDGRPPVALADDGRHDDGPAGDGCFGAVLPLAGGVGAVSVDVDADGQQRRAVVPLPATERDEPSPCERPDAGEVRPVAHIDEDGGRWVEIGPGGATVPLDVPATAIAVAPRPADRDLAWTGADGVWVRRAGRDAERVLQAEPGRRPGTLDWSPDGRRLAVEICDGPEPSATCRVLLVDPDHGTSSALSGESVSEHDPAWSPDGRRIAVARDFPEEQDARCAQEPVRCPRPSDLVIVPVDGGAPRRLTVERRGVAAPTWSPDGRRLAFSVETGAAVPRTRDVLRVDADGGGARAALPDPGAATDEAEPAWSPDGATLLVVSTRDVLGTAPEDERPRLLGVAVADGATTVLSDEPGIRAPRWRRAPDPPQANRPPVCSPQRLELQAGAAVAGEPACADPDADQLTYRLESAPSLGQVEVRSDGSVRYSAERAGTDGFAVVVTDAHGAAAHAPYTVAVADAPPPAPADPPVPPGALGSPPVDRTPPGTTAPRRARASVQMPHSCSAKRRTCTVVVRCPRGSAGCKVRLSGRGGRTRRFTVAVGAPRRLVFRLSARRRRVALRVQVTDRRSGKVLADRHATLRAGGRK